MYISYRDVNISAVQKRQKLINRSRLKLNYLLQYFFLGVYLFHLSKLKKLIRIIIMSSRLIQQAGLLRRLHATSSRAFIARPNVMRLPINRRSLHQTAEAPMMKIGDLAAHGLDTYLPTQVMEYTLEFAHVMTGLPWWATIALVTVGARALLFPCAVYGQKHLAKVNQVKPEIQLLMEKQKEAAQSGDLMANARYSQEISAFYKSRGISPFKGLAGNLPMIPVMIGMFFGIKDMANLSAITHMDQGGLWWFTNLAEADPFYVLPTLSCIGMMGTLELQNKLNAATPMSPTMIYGMRIGGLVMTYMTLSLPSGVFVFWITNNALTLLQSLVFNSKRFKTWANIVDIQKAKYARPTQSNGPLANVDLGSLIGKRPKKSSSRFVVKNKKLNKH